MGAEQEQLRALIREAHEVLRDLRTEVRAARELRRGITAGLVEEFESAARAILKRELDDFEEQSVRKLMALREQALRAVKDALETNQRCFEYGQGLMDQLLKLGAEAERAGVGLGVFTRDHRPPPGAVLIDPSTGSVTE